MFVSHAQNFEDVILWRALKHIEHGFYIDVGAQDPIDASVSLGFYEKGWRGVHIEANAAYADKIRCARPDEVVVEVAVDQKDGEIEFFEIAGTGLSTGDVLIAREHEKRGWSVVRRQVASRTLGSILDAHGERDIHWLKIDVEGMEDAVIAGWPSSTVRPWVVVVESTLPLSQVQNHLGWETTLLGLGYTFVYFDGLNRFYVSIAHRELEDSFGPGPNVFDGFKLADTSEFMLSDIAAERCKLAELEKCLATVGHERDEGQAALQAAAGRLDDERAKYAELERLLATVVCERDKGQAALQAAAGRLDDERAKYAELERLLATVVCERDKGQAALQEAASRLDDERVRCAELGTLLADKNDAYALLERQVDQGVAWQAESETTFARERQALENILVFERERSQIYRQHLDAFAASRSWKWTAPLRSGTTKARYFSKGVRAWLTLQPGSRPRRFARRLTVSSIQFALTKPWLAGYGRKGFAMLPPMVQIRLWSMHVAGNPAKVMPAASQMGVEGAGDLSAHSRNILRSLMASQSYRGSK